MTLAEAAAMPQVLLKCDRSEAVIFLHGAHVTSWKVSCLRCLLARRLEGRFSCACTFCLGF